MTTIEMHFKLNDGRVLCREVKPGEPLALYGTEVEAVAHFVAKDEGKGKRGKRKADLKS